MTIFSTGKMHMGEGVENVAILRVRTLGPKENVYLS